MNSLNSSGDLSDREGYDFDQLKAIAMVEVRFDLQLPPSQILTCAQFATLLHVAGYEI